MSFCKTGERTCNLRDQLRTVEQSAHRETAEVNRFPAVVFGGGRL